MQPAKKTLVILSPGFAADESDSTCLPMQQQFVLHLQKSAPDVEVVVFAFQYPFSRGDYSWNKIRVLSFNGRNRGGLQRLMTWNRVRRKFAALGKHHHIIGILSFWCTECALVGKYLGRRYNIRHLTWILGQDAKKENKYVRRINPKAGDLIALSDFIADEFYRNHGVRPAYTIPAGIDPDLFPAGSPERDIDVLGAGSLIPLKQYDVFIDIIAEVAKSHPGIRAVICGKGPEHERLQAQIDRLGLMNNVTLTGELPYDKVLESMKRAKIFLHTSSYEGLGMVCLEALYAGAHVISFCRPVNKDIPKFDVSENTHKMLLRLFTLIEKKETNYLPVFPYRMAETASKIINLYKY